MVQAARHRLPLPSHLALPWFNENQLLNESQLGATAAESDTDLYKLIGHALRAHRAKGWVVGQAAARALGVRHAEKSAPITVVVPNATNIIRQLDRETPPNVQIVGEYKGVHVNALGSLTLPNPDRSTFPFLVKHPTISELTQTPEPHVRTRWKVSRPPGLYLPTLEELYAIEAAPLIIHPDLAPSANPDLDAPLLGDLSREIRTQRGLEAGQLTKEAILEIAHEGTHPTRGAYYEPVARSHGSTLA